MNVDTLIDAPDKSLDYINHMTIPHTSESWLDGHWA